MFDERAVYVVEGSLSLAAAGGASGGSGVRAGGSAESGGPTANAGELVVLRRGATVDVAAAAGGVRLMLFGGDPLDGPRHLWWNFVSSSKERIEQAKADWTGGRFDAVPDETEFIPLPETPAAVPVRYP